jgi:hypothetical protein
VLAATNPVISSAADAIKIFMLSSISTSQISQSDSLGALTERRLSKIAHFGLKRAGPVWVTTSRADCLAAKAEVPPIPDVMSRVMT